VRWRGLRGQPGHEQATITLLRERELISSAYVECTLPVTLHSGETVAALVYVIDPDHDQYCGGLPLEGRRRSSRGRSAGAGPTGTTCSALPTTLPRLASKTPIWPGLPRGCARSATPLPAPYGNGWNVSWHPPVRPPILRRKQVRTLDAKTRGRVRFTRLSGRSCCWSCHGGGGGGIYS
jgi:hypothetical protein